ncbi:DUF5067 domain-containing protein [Leuconostocaceae bacterium ESL0723]|nr:DUF5067 domain-containing protein [Leuconostocaceae bacterium ESL0723]
MENGERKVLGILAIVFGGVGLLFSWVPIINNLSFILGLVGLVLGIIALFINKRNRKVLAIIGTVLSALTMVIVLAVQSSYSKTIENSIGTNSTKSSGNQKATSILNKDIDVDNGNATIKVTEYKIIQPGQPGNQYGKKPVIAFWYTTTNHTDKDLTPMNAWIVSASPKVIQDNDKNKENTLKMGSLPDDKFLESQSQNIKKDGTVEDAMAYELTDDHTPVKMIFEKSVTDKTPIAEQTFDVK